VGFKLENFFSFVPDNMLKNFACIETVIAMIAQNLLDVYILLEAATGLVYSHSLSETKPASLIIGILTA
jgi:hypothetical protein